MFRLITWLDTFDLAASLPSRMGLFGKTSGLRLLPIRGFRKGTEEADENFVNYTTAAKWPELGVIRSRIKDVGDAMLGEIEFGRIFFEMLDPGTALPWQAEASAYFQRFLRLHVAVRVNPGAAMLAAGPDGTQAFMPLPGQAFSYPALALCSAVNLGAAAAIHLVVDFRRKEPQ